LIRCIMSMMLLAIPSLAFGQEPPEAKKLADSRAKWEKVKAECKGNYEYSVRWSSAFGFGHSTTIIVRDNKVTERRFEEFSNQPVPVDPNNPAPPKKGFTETGDQIGKNAKGAPAKTLETLYDEAAKVVNAKRSDNEQLYFGVDARGLLNHCFTRDRRIADDAPRQGVTISEIKITPTAP
jgi:hypothetical protein